MLALRLLVVGFAAFVVACGGDDSVTFGSDPDGGNAGSAGSSGSAGAGASGGSAGSGTGGTGGSAGSGQGGTAGSGQGGSAGSGQGGTAGAGGSPGTEDCTNGADDDGDGQADCADSNCQGGYVCAAPPPIGWAAIGFVATSDAACPSGFDLTMDLWETSALNPDPPSCVCGCGNPQGVSCATHLYCNGGGGCSSSAQGEGVGTGCSSYNVPWNQGENSCFADAPQAGGGNCEPNVAAFTTPVTWNATSRACGSSNGGACTDATETCVPRLPGGQGPCVAQTGDVSCPGAPYTQKTLYFDGKYSDTRACEAGGCSCATPQGGSCGCAANGCNVLVYLTNSCNSNMVGVVPANGSSCDSFWDTGNQDGNWGVRLTGTTVSSPGSCPASGSGTPAGEVEPTGPVTVCCAP